MTKPITLELPDAVVDAATKAARAHGETLEAYFARLVTLDQEREATESYFAKIRAGADIAGAREILVQPRGELPSPEDTFPEGVTRRA